MNRPTLSPLVDEGLPEFPFPVSRKDAPIEGEDGRLKTRTEVWKDGVCLYAREYDQLTYGDPA